MKPPAHWQVPRELLPWGYSRPPTNLERWGAVFERWAKRGLAFAAIVAFLTITAVAVPTWIIVPRSASYRAATEFVANHPLVKNDLGSPIGAEWTPTYYAFTGDGVRFAFTVESELGRAGAAQVWVAKDASGVWQVTSASFVAARQGVSPTRVLKDGSVAGVTSR
jgi:hypothetical protein